jgi:carboxylesterase type B
MTRHRKPSTTLRLLSFTALAGVAIALAPALAAPGGIPGPNPDAPGQAKKANGPTVNTADGPVRGFVENGVNKFLGIPFAAPPVGDLRWKPPAPPASHALLDATQYADSCWVTEQQSFGGPERTSEDCLYLNIFTTGTTGAAKPVIVWIYGGGNVEGEVGLAITEYFTGPPRVALTHSPAVVAEYPLSDYGGDAEYAQNRVSTDPGKCSSLHVLKLWAPAIPTYGYDFTYANAPAYFPQMPNAFSPTGHFQGGVYHTVDIQFQYVGFHGGKFGVNKDQISDQLRELQGPEITLSDQLVAAWTNFAASGNPNGPGAPVWAVFTAGSGPFLQEDIPNLAESVAQYRINYKCDFWDPRLTYPTG